MLRRAFAWFIPYGQKTDVIVMMKTDVSIFTAADVHMFEGESRLKEVLHLVAADPRAVTPDAVLLGGDLVGRAVPPKKPGGAGGHMPPHRLPPPSPEHERERNPVFCMEEIRREITSIFPDTAAYLTYGSHDKNEVHGGAGFFSGPANRDGYYLYGISFCQMRYATDTQREEAGYDGIDRFDPLGSCGETAAANFLAWARGLPDHRPVFVMSHIPMHRHRRDNLGAAVWCRALNEAGKTRTVVVFFAHNHTAEHQTALDRQFYLVPTGAVMEVQGDQREESFETRLDFTYLNAGYILKGCGTLLTLRDEDGDGTYDKLTVQRYTCCPEDASFGDTGFVSPYTITLR